MCVFSVLPVHLTLLHHHAVGFFSHDAAVEPQLCSVDHCGDHNQPIF